MGLLAAACLGRAPAGVAPLDFALPDRVEAFEAPDWRPLEGAELLRRLAAADIVLLGELHDNAAHHRARGALLGALGARRPAVVFEQFAASAAPLPQPAAGESREAWLDARGFDRTSWKWPIHQPVVEAALRHGRALWGSGLSREALRGVVREGAAGAAEDLRGLIERVPLDRAARAALDQDLVDGHCGRLPVEMIPGMRAAQVVRDASMARALLAASADGPAWLVAGNGHVRADLAVPRLLRGLAPGKAVLSVGLLERQAVGAMPPAVPRGRYDLILVTEPASRPDPCASFRPA